MKTGKRAAAAPSGLPGEQQQARERRAGLRRRVANALLAAAGLLLLVVIVGPTSAPLEVPRLGPASRDLVALRDFDDEEPVPDLAQRQEQAVGAVPLHYTFDKAAVSRRIDALHSAFRLVRPRFRLYVADRERLTGQRPDPSSATPTAAPADAAVAALDRAIDEELDKLRPEFEALLAVRRTELTSEVFPTLRKAGFAEEIELLLADVVQVLMSERIVRLTDRFEDDLARGVLDTTAGVRYDRASMREPGRAKVLDVESAQRQAEEYVAEFVKQKKPSRFDDAHLQAALKALARSMVDVTFARDMPATQAAEEKAREAVAKTSIVRYTRGQSLVKRGDVVTAAIQQRVLRMQRGLDDGHTPRSYVATAVLLAVALALFAVFAGRHLHHFRHRPRDAHLLAAILLVHAVALRLLLGLGNYLAEPGGAVTASLWIVALPYALGPTLATLFLRPFTAAPFSLLCVVVTALMAHNSAFLREHPNLDALVVAMAMVLGLAGVNAARRFRQRSDLALGALTTSGVAMVCAVAVVLFTAPLGTDLFDVQNGYIVLMGAASGVTSYLLLSALTPIFESLFNRLTDIKLLELASMNHPALRLLATETPGTFTHSVMVGNLAQAGCDAIQANGLLARVGAYYHDLGKTRAPKYFAENQSGHNPHDKLKPHLSALIIKAHVKDGIKILRGFGLPEEIIDFAPQHHGTSLIAHFYHRAQREAVETGEEVNEADFRYPGPKPQRRETAMLMLADSVEAAAKALPDPNATRIQGLVKRIIAGKLEDGQLDECDLTLRELALIEQAFVRVLVGMHHSRPAYLPPAGQVVAPALPLLTEPRPEAVADAARIALPLGNPLTLPQDDVRRVAALADGGVGVRPAPAVQRDTVGLDRALVDTDQHKRPRDLLADGEPEAPTAVVASKTGAVLRDAATLTERRDAVSRPGRPAG